MKLREHSMPNSTGRNGFVAIASEEWNFVFIFQSHAGVYKV